MYLSAPLPSFFEAVIYNFMQDHKNHTTKKSCNIEPKQSKKKSHTVSGWENRRTHFLANKFWDF